MGHVENLYNKMLQLGQFRASDLKDVDIGNSRIGTYIFYFRKKGLIELVRRGRYKISSGQVLTRLQQNPIDKYEILYGIELEMEYAYFLL